MSALKMQTAPVASEGGELDQEKRQRFSTATPAELQENHLRGLEILADWREEIDRKRLRLELRAELIGVSEHELEELKAEVEQFKRCCRVFSWRPAEEDRP